MLRGGALIIILYLEWVSLISSFGDKTDKSASEELRYFAPMPEIPPHLVCWYSVNPTQWFPNQERHVCTFKYVDAKRLLNRGIYSIKEAQIRILARYHGNDF